MGALGYDFVRYSEDLPDKNPDEIGIETVHFMVTTKYIVIDHVAETLTGSAWREDTDRGRAEGEREAEQLVADARAKMKGGAVHV